MTAPAHCRNRAACNIVIGDGPCGCSCRECRAYSARVRRAEAELAECLKGTVALTVMQGGKR